jgi:archaeal flagellar protein FlaG
MAQNVISTAILVIAAVIAVVALINGIFPAVNQVSGSVTSLSDASSNRMKTEIRIICESANATDHTMDVYVKNTGSLKMDPARIAMTDVYFGDTASMERCNHPGSANPTWGYAIVDGNGDGVWDPGETMDIWIITDNHEFNDGRQRVKVVLYNGVSAGDTFTL